VRSDVSRRSRAERAERRTRRPLHHDCQNPTRRGRARVACDGRGDITCSSAGPASRRFSRDSFEQACSTSFPCDVLARVALAGREVSALEVELAQHLAAIASPVAALEPRVEPRVYEGDGFAVTLWTYYEAVTPDQVSPAEYADALHRLHAGMRSVEIATPHFMERVARAVRLVANRDETPALAEADRDLLLSTLQSVRRKIHSRGAAEQLLHGEPHPGNVLSAQDGPLFIDFETCCRGPIEFDVAHVPDEVSAPIRMSIKSCSASVGGLFLRWSLPGDGTPAMSSRMGTNTAETS
jgi:Phosphotransferase enzyme family